LPVSPVALERQPDFSFTIAAVVVAIEISEWFHDWRRGMPVEAGLSDHDVTALRRLTDEWVQANLAGDGRESPR